MRIKAFLAPLACLSVATCAAAPSPSPLEGLWSGSAATCAAGFGLRFAGDAVIMVMPERNAVLFDRVTYEARSTTSGSRLIVRFLFGEHSRGAIVFDRPSADQLLLAQHRSEDPHTGASRVSLSPRGGAFKSFATLFRCDETGLRGGAQA